MSYDWYTDIINMHDHYGVQDVVDTMDADKLRKFLQFRIKFLEEELTELQHAENAEDVIDALIDLVVVAIGTLDSFRVDAHTAWNEVLKANMAHYLGC